MTLATLYGIFHFKEVSSKQKSSPGWKVFSQTGLCGLYRLILNNTLLTGITRSLLNCDCLKLHVLNALHLIHPIILHFARQDFHTSDMSTGNYPPEVYHECMQKVVNNKQNFQDNIIFHRKLKA